MFAALRPLKIDNSTRLAAERNRLALERTLMARVWSAISLITFGYGFYKAGQLIGPTCPMHQAWLGPFYAFPQVTRGAHFDFLQQRPSIRKTPSVKCFIYRGAMVTNI